MFTGGTIWILTQWPCGLGSSFSLRAGAGLDPHAALRSELCVLLHASSGSIVRERVRIYQFQLAPKGSHVYSIHLQPIRTHLVRERVRINTCVPFVFEGFPFKLNQPSKEADSFFFPWTIWASGRRLGWQGMFSSEKVRPHILLNGRTTHKEIPEGDTPEEIAEAEKLKEELRWICVVGCRAGRGPRKKRKKNLC